MDAGPALDVTVGPAGPITALRWALFDGHPVDVLVTTRHGGVSTGPYATLNLGLHVGDDPRAVVENRRRAAAAIGLDLADLVFCQQSHGRAVVRVTAADKGRGSQSDDNAVPGADALVTADPDVGLVVMVADCVPIVLFDPVTPSVACVHAGWRGTVARVVDATIDAMVVVGSRPSDLLVGMGPAVPAERYQVGEEVVAAAHECFGRRTGELITPDGAGRWRFDLWAANLRLLVEAGVPRANVAISPVPTGGDGPFYSDRAVRPCGRFAALARLRWR